LKDVKFPLEFDAFELCSPELQNKLAPMREKFKEYEDSLVEKSCNAKPKKDKGDSTKKKKQEPFWFKNGNRRMKEN
jgi:ubiquitin carboxyl-terminal hydrolase 14